MAEAAARITAELAAAAGLDVWAVADALWLAAQVPLPPEVTRTPAVATEPAPVREVPVRSDPPAPRGPAPSAPVVERTPVSRAPRVGRQVTVAAPRVSLDVLRVGRALKPFMRPWRKGLRHHLDIDATIERYGSDGILVPVTSPEPERWFDVVVVVDTAVTMALWHDDITAFVALLRGMGAFRQVWVWRLDEPDVARRLRTPGGRRLVMVFSDFADQSWRSERGWRLVRTAASVTPTVIVNPLPSRLWRHSGLSQRRIRLRSDTPGRMSTVDGLPVPAVEMTPVSLGRWANALMRSAPAGCDAVLVGQPPRRGLGASVAELADSFLHTATPDAVRLAVLCSRFAQFGLPLLHLVREVMVPSAGLTDAAEFLGSGLLRVVSSDVRYPVLAFLPEARPLVQDRLTQEDAWEMVSALTERVGALTGSDGVSALILDPAARSSLPAEVTEFAEAAADLLHELDADDAPEVVREVPEPEARIVKITSGRRVRTGLVITPRLVLVVSQFQDLPDQVEVESVAGTVIWRHEGYALITTEVDVVSGLPPVRWGVLCSVGERVEYKVIGVSRASTRLIITVSDALADSMVVEYPRYLRDGDGYQHSDGAVVFYQGLVVGVVPTITYSSGDVHPVVMTRRLLGMNNFREVVAAHAGVCLPEPLELVKVSMPPPLLPTFGHVRTPAALLEPSLRVLPSGTEQEWLETVDDALFERGITRLTLAGSVPDPARLTALVAAGLPPEWAVVWTANQTKALGFVPRGPVVAFCVVAGGTIDVQAWTGPVVPLPRAREQIATPRNVRKKWLRRTGRALAALPTTREYTWDSPDAVVRPNLYPAANQVADLVDFDERYAQVYRSVDQRIANFEKRLWGQVPREVRNVLMLLDPVNRHRAYAVVEACGVADPAAVLDVAEALYPGRGSFISPPAFVRWACVADMQPSTLADMVRVANDAERVRIIHNLDSAVAQHDVAPLIEQALDDDGMVEIVLTMLPRLSNPEQFRIALNRRIPGWSEAAGPGS
ncbi:SAV_2336 N-terminal domain-related protein [Actinokineospora inagensis]|uniref:SAV_2336 N-terminal domain-related protein n=1 Tax=Actinokineospora inagensis TaxID=103730 RepID=UPI0004091872|nr:SAV_2336 N-terminal domain-related protein [Actinokineospora inagensis]